MIVGYARTSTLQQAAGFEAQLRDLDAAGVDKVFQEQVSSFAQRDQLKEALNFVRDGDTFIVTKLDRLARSVRDLQKITDELESKRVHLKILGMGLDTSTAIGKMMLTVMAAVAQFEREMMLERQREGIEKAMREGRMKGRPSTVNFERFKEIEKDGVLSVKHACRQLCISKSYYYQLRLKNKKGLL